MSLKEYLSKYTYLTCPDYYLMVWRILFLGDKYNKEVIRQAEEDMREEEKLRPQLPFNRDRRKITDSNKKKYNWY